MFSRFGNLKTDVDCPGCRQGKLFVQRFCRQTTLECTICQKGFTFEDLATRLDDETFDKLAEAVQDRLSDRV